VLDNIASTLGEYRQTMVEVAGHTDDVGDDQSNQVLSERRAAAVASYLESRGVMQERIMIVGAGEAHPIANNDTEAGRAENRRVEITIVPVKA
jgi:outer membrane protein OmpA-like peptidoglycan-associated protein